MMPVFIVANVAHIKEHFPCIQKHASVNLAEDKEQCQENNKSILIKVLQL